MNFLRSPKTKYKNYFDQARFAFVWYICLFQLVLMTINALSLYIVSDVLGRPDIAIITLMLVALVVLSRTKKYELISKVGVIATFLILSYTLLIITDYIHINTPMWMILNILFAFFVLGHKWGVFFCVAHFIVLTQFFVFNIRSNIENLNTLDQKDIINFIVEAVVICAAVIYFNLTRDKIIKHNQNKVRVINQKLNKKNQIIEHKNDEISTLFKESHHRIKNNLQIIISLLRLQMMGERNPAESAVITDAVNRINSISAIHEYIYNHNPLESFDMESHIKNLIDEIVSTFNTHVNLQLIINVNVQKIGSKSTVLVSLLINELVTNSMKYAFLNKPKGKIQVDIKPNASERLKYDMLYMDSGCWVEKKERKSLGSDLIASMVTQMNGIYEIVKEPDSTKYAIKNLNFSE
ncbi:MAG: sensor histidine kinase [Saprospiraceae bacterium]|nr:sensor histidine kinase [Saprospiraceae bacterium]